MPRQLFPILLTVFIDVLGLTLVIPLLPFYALHYGASPFVVGVFLATYAACQLISSPILGTLSDRRGRKPVLLASQAGTVVGFLVLGTATSLPLLFLGRIIDGLTAGNLSVAQAYISDATRPEDRTRAFAFIGIAFGVGFLLGPALSGLLAHRLGYQAPALGAAALSLASVVVTWRLLPSDPRSLVDHGADSAPRPSTAPAAVDRRRIYQRPETRGWLLEFFAYILSFAIFTGGLALFLDARFGYNVEQVGYVFGFMGLCGILVQGGLIGRLVRRLGERNLSLVGFGSLAVGSLSLIAASSLPALLGVIAVGAFGASVVRPCLTTLLTKSVGRGDQGLVLGASQSVSSVGQVLGPIIAGFVIDRGWLWAFGAGVAMVATAGAALRFRLGSDLGWTKPS